jgi:hypothetical protein
MMLIHFLGIFGRQGVEYKDWLNCSVKIPLGTAERRG